MVVIAHRISSNLLAVLREPTDGASAGAGGGGGIGGHIGEMVLLGRTGSSAEAVVVLRKRKKEGKKKKSIRGS